MSSQGAGDRQHEIPVLLLKTKSTPTDGYEDELLRIESARFKPSFIAVFEHAFVEESLAWLGEAIKQGRFVKGLDASSANEAKFGGLILTSQRAVEALGSALRAFTDEEKKGLLPSDVPVYIVGPATARAARALDLSCAILGDTTGNGEALADFILDQYESPAGQDGCRLPLLFLVGEKRRDIIPRKLQDPTLGPRRIRVEEKTVYGTVDRAGFEEELREVLSSRMARPPDVWIVVFSPSGCDVLLRVLGWTGADGRCDVTVEGREKSHIRVATIGPTTRDHMIRELGFTPHVSAAEPTPGGVAKAILHDMLCHKEHGAYGGDATD